MLLQVFLLLLALPLLASLHQILQHDIIAAACSSLALAGKVFLALEGNLFHSPMLEKSSGPGKETFPALRNVKRKRSHSKTGKLFRNGGMEKSLWVLGIMFLYCQRAFYLCILSFLYNYNYTIVSVVHRRVSSSSRMVIESEQSKALGKCAQFRKTARFLFSDLNLPEQESLQY
jgi:hypothetical protein